MIRRQIQDTIEAAPTTSWPCSTSSAAATELSTPPDKPTRIRATVLKGELMPASRSPFAESAAPAPVNQIWTGKPRKK